jgi:hypothetical protein
MQQMAPTTSAAPMAPQAIPASSVPPGAESGGDDKYFQMVARIPDMTDDELGTYVNSGYGALALAEISRRNRARLAAEAQQMAGVQGEGTIADKQIAELMQNRMRERMSADDRFGLNNIVSQAEQGGLQFGQPTATLAGGGIVSFQAGGRSFLDELLMMAAPMPSQMVNKPPLRSQDTSGPIVGRQATQADVRRVDNEIARKAEQKAPEEKSTKSEVKQAREVAAGLKSLSAKDILRAEKELMAAEGLGAFGAGAQDIISKRRARGEKTYEKALASEPFLAAAQALGGRRMTNLEALAAAVGAGGTSATGISRERAKFQDDIDDLNQKLALQQELYNRGRISDAMKLERDIKTKQAELALEREKLSSLAQYREGMIRAQAGKGAGRIPQTILAQLEKQAGEIRAAVRLAQITPAQGAAELAELERTKRGYLASALFAGATYGERDTAGEE